MTCTRPYSCLSWPIYCARAAEARIFPDDVNDQEASFSRGKNNQKHKPQAILAAGPERKPQSKEEEDSPDKQDDRPYCALHNSHTHDTVDCREVKLLGEEHQKELREKRHDGEKREGGRGSRHSDKRRGCGSKRDHPPRGRDNQDDNNVNNDLDSNKEESEGAFQEPKGVACIHGGVQNPHSNHHFKQLAREVNAALPGVDVPRPLKWTQVPITFNAVDHPISVKGVGLVLLVVLPETFENVLSPETFEKIQIPFKHLMPTKPF